MKRIRVHIAGAAAIAAAALVCVGGCSAPDGGSADAKPAGSPRAGSEADLAVAREPKACRGGTYTWFNLRQDWMINGVTEAQSLTRSARVTKPIRRLRTDPASVVTEGADLDPDLVLHSLGTKLGLVSADDDPRGGVRPRRAGHVRAARRAVGPGR
ncbi:hypothetical protein [Streptomyces sp. NPDC052291]|uniref:hypothetical protein n=1 Tax=Streptomyces sp. NPDC052291 TaxID=3161011 RepID=UPI00344190C1